MLPEYSATFVCSFLSSAEIKFKHLSLDNKNLNQNDENASLTGSDK